MAGKRKIHSSNFKFKVALEAARGRLTAREISQKYGVHQTQVNSWKKQLLDNGVELFEGKRGPKVSEADAAQPALYEEIGRLKMELDWLKKKEHLFED